MMFVSSITFPANYLQEASPLAEWFGTLHDRWS